MENQQNLSQNTMSSPGPESPLVLSLRGVSKAFGAVQALRDVSVDCRAGEIHALVGENGSGKSTLLGIASGFVAPDAGVVEIGGLQRRRVTPAETRRLGLGIAYQTYSHVLDLSVAENLYLAAPADAATDVRTHGGVGGATSSAEFELDVPVAAPTRSLSLAQRQLLEVVKALLARPKVLLLDEPTTALGPDDVERLHALVFEQSRAGVGIVYVSHRLPEVLGIADRITVLRDGVCQGTFEAAAMSEESLVALMIGRPLELAFPGATRPRGATRGAARRLGPARRAVRADRPRGREGRDPRDRGRRGQRPGAVPPCARRRRARHRQRRLQRQRSSTRSRRSAPLRAGVVLLSGDRARRVALPRPQRPRQHDDPGPAAARTLRLPHRGRERRTVDELVRRLRIRLASIEQPVQSLSGGNQQKVSLTRPFLRGDVNVILAEEPTQGVDVAARFDIYDALREKAKEGVAMIVKSSDPLELAGLCDRVVVMSRGKIVDEIRGDELGERRIVEAIVGSRPVRETTEAGRGAGRA